MTTILDILKSGTEYLTRHGVEEARLNMELMMAHVLGVGRMQLYIDFDRPLSEDSITRLREFTIRRGKREPLQYILGSVEFCDLEFLVDPRVLIPRPETEELVYHLLKRDWPEGARILDVGCGSGAIGLSLAHHLASRNVHVTLVDISPDALALAKENARRLLSDSDALPIRFVESDLFSALENQQFHLIVSNLPYVSLREKDRGELSPEVLREPALALFGGDVGDEIQRRCLSSAWSFLLPGGSIAMELGIADGTGLKQLAETMGYEPVALKSDLSGIQRFLFAEKPASV